MTGSTPTPSGLAAEARRRLATGDPGLARTAVAAGLALARGPLLPDEPDAPWAEADRASAARLQSQLHHAGAEAALAAGAWAATSTLAHAALDHDGYDEGPCGC